jgi:hypothetical protein
MKKLLLLLLCVPLIGFAQNNDVKMLSISESEFINCQNKYLDIKKSGISFINFYQYDCYENGGLPVLYIDAKESDVKKVLIGDIGCDGALDFNYIKIGSFFDFNFWVILEYSLDGEPSINLVNKSDNSQFYLGSYYLYNLLNDIVFYSNNYFIINYNNGCGAMDGCDHRFSLFKIENNKIIKVFSTHEFFSGNIKWQDDKILFIETKSIISYEEDSDKLTFEKNFIQLIF